jgi:subtilisin family serine protease
MKKRVISIMILISLLLVNMAFVNSETNNKISSDVYKNLEKNDEVRVIVEIKEPNPEKGFIIKSKKSDYEIEIEKEEIKDEIKQDVGENNIKHEFYNKISLEVSQEGLKKLNKNTNVETVSLVGKMYAFLQDSVPLINATRTWPLQISGINLTGIKDTVCIVDTGVNFNHPDLIGKNKTCVIDCIGKACVENCSVGDDHGHGTHVAGIVGANESIKGVGIGISLIGVKVLNAAGGGNTDDVYAGIDWCVDNSATYNISVISMSLGDCTNHSTYCNNDGSVIHINAAVAKNISVVIAAGNGPGGNCPPTGLSNVDGPSAPACVENATAIGAVSKSDVITYQRGNLFEIMAPGISINSTKSTGGYELRSGTSMATPHAAGAFAIIRQAFRLMNNRIPTPLEIRNILNSTGKIIYDSGGTNLNFSRINIYAAVISLDNISPNVNLKSPLNNHINMSYNYTFFAIIVTGNSQMLVFIYGILAVI